jgi:hypothetical protein
LPSNVFIEAHEVNKDPDGEVLIVTTGSQGETMSALYRMATDEHRHIKIKPSDRVIISAKAIPGNEGSISTILNIGGFIVIFSVIISILKNSNILLLLNPIFEFLHIPSKVAESFILGIVEITNGIFTLSNIPQKKLSINIILSAFLLGCGGISIFLQVWNIVSKTDLSIKPYIIGKILHGAFSAFYTFIFIWAFPIFCFDL